MKTYRIKAHVFVVAEAECSVDAPNTEEARKRAKEQFDKSHTFRRDCVVPNSVDATHPFDFEILEVTEES